MKQWLEWATREDLTTGMISTTDVPLGPAIRAPFPQKRKKRKKKEQFRTTDLGRVGFGTVGLVLSDRDAGAATIALDKEGIENLMEEPFGGGGTSVLVRERDAEIAIGVLQRAGIQIIDIED